MSWWQTFIISSAEAFFATLINSNQKIKDAVKPYAKKIIESIHMAYPGDPDLQ